MIDALCLLVGLLCGAGLTFLATRPSGRESVAALVRPIEEGLGRVDAQLSALNQERFESRGRLESQLASLAEGQRRVATETDALVTALSRPSTRGQWGELQLRRVVELAGMLRHCDFTEQRSLTGEERGMRPDLIVNLPGDKHVVVDAKAPLQAVLDAYQARDESTREQALAEHARLLRRHVRLLADKAYWAGLEATPEFVVLFLPGEHLYSSALEADPELIEDAMAQRVLIATPTTLLALLRTVAYGWQQERVAESAQAVAELGRELHGRLARMAGLLATVGVRLNAAVSAYNETVGSYEARVLPSARRFVDHGVVANEDRLADVEPIRLAARDLRGR